MKKRLLFLTFSLTSLIGANLKAQTVPVSNGGFENWTQKSYEVPDVGAGTKTSYFQNANQQSYTSSNVLAMTKVTNGGGYAMRVETKTYGTRPDTTAGYALWGSDPGNSNPPLFPGGFAFTDQNVTGLKADLRYSINAGSPGMILIQFKKNGTAIGGGNAPWNIPGLYVFTVSGTQSIFSASTFSFSLPSAPDTVAIAFTSNNPFHTGPIYPGDYMEIDNISFTGTTQTVPGGNLDSWITTTLNPSLDSWTFDDGSINYQTNDAHSGNYALKLPVFQNNHGGGGNTNQSTRAQLGGAIYSQNNPPEYIPGMKLSGAPQSLMFYYKYSTPATDTASVYVVLTQWDAANKVRNVIGDQYAYIYPSSNYAFFYTQIGYKAAGTPDSAYIEFQASKQSGNNPVIGSLLTLDDVSFNYCGESLSISGNTSICANSTGAVYMSQSTPGSTYAWSLPTGASISAGSGTDTITVDFGAVGGTIGLTKTYVDGCPNTTANLGVNIVASATANAGSNANVCANSSIQLNGSVTGAGGGTWTGGAGTFSPDANSLNAMYTPSASEISGGSVNLILTTTGNGGCTPATSNVTLTVTSAPTVNAGSDQTVCANSSSATLNGSVTIATGGTWTGGNGAFSPDANTLNASYTPTLSEIAAGTVTLTLTTTGNGTCLAVGDPMIITITAAPTASAGADQTICSTASATLNGSVTVATGGIWSSSGTGTFSPNATTLNATYTPSASDIVAGSVTLTLASSGNGNCNAIYDNAVITVNNCTGVLSSIVSNGILKVYPSPSNSTINVEVESGSNIKDVNVLNSLQENVSAKVISIAGNKAIVDLSSLNTGIYFIRVFDGSIVSTQKIVKE